MLVRLRHTPLIDLLRGHVSGRLDWRQLIDSSDAAPEVKELVTKIVVGTRLWAAEKVEVAIELLAHFSDGIEAGSTSSQLIEEFGNVDQLAPLIRRSKMREQSFIWQSFRWSCIAITFLFIYYCGLALYFYAGYPSPKVDFIAQMNQRIGQTPLNQRAWPIYRTALLSVRDNDTRTWDAPLERNPEGKHWPEIASWIDAHQAAIASIREATKLPVLGFILGRHGSVADAALFPAVPPRADEGISGMPLPQLEDIRILSDLLTLDGKRAREQGDGVRVEGDISALSSLAEQQRCDAQLYLCQLVSLNILSRSYDQLDRTLVDSASVLDDAALARIAQRISAPKTAGDILSFACDRLLFDDIVQRIYTDDGHGSGRISSAGLDFIRANFPQSQNVPEEFFIRGAPRLALQPIFLPMTCSRKDLLDEYNKLMGLNDAMIQAPLRYSDFAPFERELRTLTESPFTRMRYSVLLTLVPMLQRSAQIAERTLGERDGLAVAIGLELYRRRHNEYPQTLAQLTPDLLPAVPPDRITGDPLKYRLIDGKPLVYSVGVDRIDDGGRLPTRNGRSVPYDTAGWGSMSMMVSGDWILYPKPRIAVIDEQDD